MWVLGSPCGYEAVKWVRGSQCGYTAFNLTAWQSIWALGSPYGYLAVNVDTGQSMLKMAQQRLEAQPAKLLPAKGHQVVAPWVAAESKGVCTCSYQLKCSVEPAEVQLNASWMYQFNYVGHLPHTEG